MENDLKHILVESTNEMNSLLELLQSYEAEFSLITGKKPGRNKKYEPDVNLNETHNYLLFDKLMTIGFCIKGTTENREIMNLDEDDIEGSEILEQLAQIGKIDEFMEAVDSDDINKAKILLKQASIDSKTISIVLKQMKTADGTH